MRTKPVLDFETLVELYYQPVFSFAVKLCGKLDRALELTQHTFCSALDRKHYLRENESAKGWLLTLLFREFLKRKRVEANASSFIGHRRPSAPTQPVMTWPRVPDEAQLPLVLFYARDFSCSQIAEYLGISLAAVFRLLSKGREGLNLAPAARPATARRAMGQRRRRFEPLPLAA